MPSRKCGVTLYICELAKKRALNISVNYGVSGLKNAFIVFF